MRVGSPVKPDSKNRTRGGMKFFVDAQLPRRLADQLAAAGHDVLRSADDRAAARGGFRGPRDGLGRARQELQQRHAGGHLQRAGPADLADQIDPLAVHCVQRDGDERDRRAAGASGR